MLPPEHYHASVHYRGQLEQARLDTEAIELLSGTSPPTGLASLRQGLVSPASPRLAGSASAATHAHSNAAARADMTARRTPPQRGPGRAPPASAPPGGGVVFSGASGHMETSGRPPRPLINRPLIARPSWGQHPHPPTVPLTLTLTLTFHPNLRLILALTLTPTLTPTLTLTPNPNP